MTPVASSSESLLQPQEDMPYPARPLDSIWISQVWPNGALPISSGTCLPATMQPEKLTELCAVKIQV